MSGDETSLKIEHPVMCLATKAYVNMQLRIHVSIFSTGFKFYRVTCSYSSHPFLCAINWGCEAGQWHGGVRQSSGMEL